MLAVESHEAQVIVSLSREELVILSNSINETLEVLEAIEFETRVGGTREKALKLHQEISELLSSDLSGQPKV